MSLRQKVKLELEDGTEVVAEYSAIDLRAWENKHAKSSLVEQMSVSMLTWLGWSAAVRQGLVDGQLKDWRNFDAACVSVEGVAPEEPETPTQAGESIPPSPGDEPSAS